MSEMCLKDIWKAFEMCVGSVRKLSGQVRVSERCLESVWRFLDRLLRVPQMCIESGQTSYFQPSGGFIQGVLKKS